MDLGKSAWILVLIFALLTLIYNFLYPQKFPKIPGDIYYDKNGFRFYIPWISSLVLTILASYLLSKVQF